MVFMTHWCFLTICFRRVRGSLGWGSGPMWGSCGFEGVKGSCLLVPCWPKVLYAGKCTLGEWGDWMSEQGPSRWLEYPQCVVSCRCLITVSERVVTIAESFSLSVCEALSHTAKKKKADFPWSEKDIGEL